MFFASLQRSGFVEYIGGLASLQDTGGGGGGWASLQDRGIYSYKCINMIFITSHEMY